MEDSKKDLMLIVCGGREYNDKDRVYRELDAIVPKYNSVEIVTGQATGADSIGEQYAIEHDMPVAAFPADWGKNGKAAGPIRNKQMLDYLLHNNQSGDTHIGVLAFWNGVSPGTHNMIRQAVKAGVKVKIVRY